MLGAIDLEGMREPLVVSRSPFPCMPLAQPLAPANPIKACANGTKPQRKGTTHGQTVLIRTQSTVPEQTVEAK